MIATVAELIEALGGTKAVCEARGVGKTAVSHWRVTNTLPERHHYWAAAECTRLNLTVSPELFAASEPIRVAS